MRKLSVKRAVATGVGLTVAVTGGLAGTTATAAAVETRRVTVTTGTVDNAGTNANLPALAGAPAMGGIGITRVSVSSAGVQGNHQSDGQRISADGRYAAFTSSATNLVDGDTNGSADVFVRDLKAGINTLVSLSRAGVQGDNGSAAAAISANGRYVAFTSSATNLVDGDTNGTTDVFVRDRQTGTTSRVSLTSSQEQANGYSGVADISGDGRYVMFGSHATNLVPGGDNNGAEPDVFIRDRQTAQTTRASVSTEGVQPNNYSSAAAISTDGRYVTFTSQASDLAPGDTNGRFDAFVRDRVAGTTTRVSLPSDSDLGAEANADSYAQAISSDGRYVAFNSDASNLVPGDTNNAGDVFLRDRRTGTTTRVSLSDTGDQAVDGFSSGAAISANGQYVAFASFAGNLVPGDTNVRSDVFVRDRRAATTTRISVSNSGAQGDRESHTPRMSADGRSIVFYSESTNLVPGDTNDFTDVFLHRRARA